MVVVKPTRFGDDKGLFQERRWWSVAKTFLYQIRAAAQMVSGFWFLVSGFRKKPISSVGRASVPAQMVRG